MNRPKTQGELSGTPRKRISDTKRFKRDKHTGLQYVATRKLQPYSVWIVGHIVAFCANPTEADHILNHQRPARKLPAIYESAQEYNHSPSYAGKAERRPSHEQTQVDT